MKYKIFNNKFFKTSSIIMVWLIIWQIIYMIINNDMLIVSPASVFICLFKFITTYDFWNTIFLTIIRIFSGFIFAVLFGIFLAVISTGFRKLDLFIKPIILIIKATPVVSLIILVTAFINTAFIPTFISFLMVLPVIYNNIYQGILHTDYRLLEMAKIFRIKNINIIKNIYLQSIIPYFISAVNSSVGFAWKSGISAEILVKTKMSIGNQISSSKINMNIVELFTWTVVIIILCFLLERFTIFIVRKLFKVNRLDGDNFAF